MSSLALAAVVIAAAMLALWMLSLALEDSSIVDIFWGPGFVLVAWVVALQEGWSERGALATGLVTVWGLRLAVHLAVRNIGKGEDPRYQAMRRARGPAWWWKSLFIVFAFQGVLIWVVSLPLQQAIVRGGALGIVDALAIAVFVAGLYFETVGDWQLVRFKAQPANRGRVMDQGLWRYTRHPNYFGDFLVWWGLYGLALAAGAWWTVVGPLVMSFLLLRVSGVTLLEQGMKSRPGYEDYVRRTSAFFPRPPRQDAPSSQHPGPGNNV
jgi:steroid 5-alpha reductase family enzyme